MKSFFSKIMPSKILSSKLLSTKFFWEKNLGKMDKKYLVWIWATILAVIIIIVLISVFAGIWSKQKGNKCKISKSIIQMSDIGSCTWTFVSYSDSYKESKSGVFSFTWSKWVNWDKFQNIDLQNTLSSSFFYYKFFDKTWLDQNLFLYDETNWLKAGLLVFIMRSLGKDNTYLLQWKDITTLATQNKEIVDDNLKDLFSGDNQKIYNKWYIDNGKYKVVFDTTGINLWEKDLFLYICDKWMMNNEPFYLSKKNIFKDNFKNIYISYFISMEWSGIKNKEEVNSLLFNEWIDLSKYDNVYIYYPGDWRKWGLVGLIFLDYFG